MINLGDRLHAATEQGVLGGANEIFDDTQNKMQSTINAEVQTALEQRATTASVTAEAAARQASDKKLKKLIYAAL